MPAGLIQYHHAMHIGRQFTRELFEKHIHRIGIDLGRNQTAGIAAFWADG